jgi:RND family efflux transporter MFP subunit
MKFTRFAGLCLFTFSTLATAGDELVLSPRQISSLGLRSAPLPARQSGEISGLPAQVVVPSNQLFVVSTPLPAMIEQTLVGVGDAVKKGQLLARLQSPALAEAQRGLLQTSTQAQLAGENLARDEQLWKEGIISESRYRTTRSQQIEAAAALAERRQMLHLSGMSDAAIAQLQSGKSLSSLLAVTSPIDGVILEKSAGAGQRLDAAAPLFKVAQLHPLALEIQSPLAQTPKLQPGAAVTIPKSGASGKLTAVGRNLSGSNQTILLRARIDQGTDNLRPGQFVEASIAVAGKTTHWSLPNGALVRLDGKTLVFVATDQGFRPVHVGVVSEGADNTLVSATFKGDEKIVTHGASSLKARMMGIGGGE